MARRREIKKIGLSAKALEAMPPRHRSALLMLGVFLNEANWLRKLLVSAVLGMSEDLEGQASFALTMVVATTLAGKIHEGGDRLREGWLHEALAVVDLPDALKALQSELATALSSKTLVRIRNNIAFHYPERPLDFKKLTHHIDDSDAIIFVAPEEYGGDVLSHLSTLAGIEPLLAIHKELDYRMALKAAWEELTHAAGLYCRVVSDLMTSLLLKLMPPVSVEDVSIADAPEATEVRLRFFVHPPDDLDEMRATVARA